jgi:hypothetical protein
MRISIAPLLSLSQRSCGDMKQIPKTAKQIIALFLVIALFAAFNLSMYMLLTGRLSNNFSDATQAKMIDVSKFLPHEDGSELAHIES